MNKAIFIDKDGTLIKNIPFNSDAKKIELIDGAGEALNRLQEIGFKVVIITNQSGIARGFFNEADLIKIKEKLTALMAQKGVGIFGFFYCPHHPEGKIKKYKKSCDCRKPKPGLIFKAASLLDIDLSKSWMIGDILDDIEAGNRAGCKTILCDPDIKEQEYPCPLRTPDFKIETIRKATDIIALSHQESFPFFKNRGKINRI